MLGLDMEPARRGRPWAAGLGLLALVLLLTWVTSGPAVNLFAPFDDATEGASAPAPTYTRHEGLPEMARGSGGGTIWLVVVAMLLAVALVAALVVLMRRLRPPRPLHPPDRNAGSPAQPTTAARPDVGVDRSDTVLDRAQGVLTSGTDSRSAIARTWQELERLASPDREALPINRTPDDVTRLLGQVSGDREASERFEQIYVEARYGAAPVTEAQRERAVALLDHLRRRIRVGADGRRP